MRQIVDSKFVKNVCRWSCSPIGLMSIALVSLSLYLKVCDPILSESSERMKWLLLPSIIVDVSCFLAICFFVPGTKMRQIVLSIILFFAWLLGFADVVSLRFYGYYFNLKWIGEAQNLNGIVGYIFSITRIQDYIFTIFYAAISFFAVKKCVAFRTLELKRAVIALAYAVTFFLLPFI